MRPSLVFNMRQLLTLLRYFDCDAIILDSLRRWGSVNASGALPTELSVLVNLTLLYVF